MAPESKRTGQGLGADEPPSERTEEEIVAAAKNGDSEAFEELVRMTQDRLYNLAYRMTGHREEAEDVLQEAYLRAHRSLSSFEGTSQIYTWLYRITVNACLTRGRKTGRRSEVEGVRLDAPTRGSEGETALVGTFASGDGGPGETISMRERAERVHQAIGELPEEYRTVVVLRDIEGLSYEELGEATGSSRAAIKSRLHRARQRLSEMLQDLR